MKKFYCIKSINIKVPKKTNTFFALFFNIFFLIGTSTFASGVVANSDSVDATTITAFPIGTYIIDMGQATQTVNNGLKPYGLVYKLIVAGIPVNWAIEETKTKDGIDFYATSAGNPNKAYKGGSFIVDVVTYPAAKDIINSWKTLYSGLVVDIATAPFSAPIYKTLSIWPKAFLDADNDTLITPYYTNAGIPSNTYQINANPTLLPQCGSSTGTQDVYILPHADPDTWNATWISTLQNFIDNGGSMWAGCHAVSVMEGLPGCNFLSVNGLVNYKVPGHTAGSPAYTYLPSADNDPIMQFIGITDAALQGGSEDIYVPGPAGWRNTTVLAAYDANYVNAVPNPDVQYIYPNAAAVIAYGPAFGDASKGMIMYETGHSFNGTDAKSVAAQRAFFNFLLLAGGQPQNSIAPPSNMANQSITTCSGVPFNFTPAGAAANVTYSWTVLPTGSGFTGATIQTTGQTSISQTLTLTTSNPGVAVYTITPKIGLCSGTPFTLTVTVNPPIPIITLTSGAGTNTVTTPIGIAMKNITYATTGATGVTFSGLPPGVTGTWSGGIVTISGVPTNPVGVYNYTVNVAGCSNVSTTGSITTYVCPTFSLLSTSTSSVNVCVGSSSLITLTANAANLPVGNYAVTYNIQGVDQADATMTVTTAGIGSFVYTGFTSAGDRTVTITKITSGLCSSVISANNMDTITVVAVLAAPTALAGSGATCTQITANWTALSGAAYYELDVSVSSTFDSFISGYNALNVGLVTSYNVTGLTIGTPYYYRVRAFNGNCISSSSSTITYATAANPGTPGGLTTIVNACDELTVSWTAGSGATSYEIQWSTNASNFATILGTAIGITTLKYTITGLTSGIAYKYRVRSVNGCNSSAYVPSGSITAAGSVPTRPGSISPTANSTFCNQFSVNWPAGTGATSYRIDWSTNSSFPTGFASVSGITDLTYTIIGLTAATAYFYRIYSENGCGLSTARNGTPTSVTTLSATPSAPIGVGSSSILCTQFTMSWTASTGAISYTVERALDSGFSNGLVTVTDITATTYTFTGLNSGTNYYYRVRAVSCNSSANGNGSPAFITTSSSLPTTPTIAGALTFCENDSVTLGANTGVSGSYDWYWNGSLISTETTGFLFVITPGSYTVRFTNASGCQSAASAASVIVVQGLPTAAAGGSQSICANATATVSGAAATNGDVLWTANGAGTITSGATTLTPTYTPAAGDAGNAVTLTMTVTSNNTCAPQTAIATYTVNVAAVPTAGLTSNDADNTFCIGTPVTFTATGGTNYNFRVAGISVQNGAAATYTSTTLTNGQVVDVIVANAAGCSATSPGITNTVNALPIAGLTSNDVDHIFCAGTPVTFTATGGTNYNFRVAGITIQNGAAATYTSTTLTNGQVVDVIVSNASGCSATSPGITNTVSALPVINTQPISQLDCEAASVNFKAVVTGTGLTYTWQRKKVTDSSFVTIPTEGNISYPATGVIKVDNIGSSQSPNGTQFQVVVSDSSGCSVVSAIATLSVNEITDVLPKTTAVTQCYGTNYSYTVSTSYPANVVSYQWKSAVASGVWNTVSNGPHFSGATTPTLNIINGTPSESAEYRVYITFRSSGADCNVTSASRTRTLTFLPLLTTPVTTVTQPTCTIPTGTIAVTVQSASDSYSFDNGGSYQAGNVKSGSATGNYSVIIKNSQNCISATASTTINAQPETPLAPVVGAITQPACSLATGSVVLSGLPAGGTLNPGTIAYVGTTCTVSNLATSTYIYTVTNASGCISANSSSVLITPMVTNTWSASGWSSGSNPTVDQNIVFDFDFSSTADLAGCTCQIRSGRSITINPLHTLTVNNAISVLGTGTLIFKSDQTHTPSSSASLVQINDGANTGNITFERITNTVVRNMDYTYWSSPVAAYTLGGVSQNKTKSDKYYSYEPTATGQDWKQESAATVMAPGKGYIIRGPEPPTVVSPYLATFTGVPNNGPYSITPIFAGKNYLLGNPYPSALNADTFLNENAGVLDGTLYFWTHNTQIQLASNITDGSAGSGAYAYTSNDYASYNITGGVGITDKAKNPGGNGFIPSGKIAAGQGFFGTTKASGSESAIVFNNAMRVTGTSNNNSQFFKTGSTKAKTAEIIEKHRIWLDLTNSQGAFKQTLVGYITGATNDYDSRFDGESLDGNQFVDFYSINQNKHLTIQGRAVPFDENDLVPLGFRTTIDGIFTLKIDQVDGLFWNQAVFLEDKLTNTLFDLKRDGYTFTTASGTYNDRFVLRYTGETLGTAAVGKPANRILVSIQNEQLKINSSAETIDRVVVYDLSGKQRYQKRKVNSNEVLLTTLAPSHQILLVKTVLHNGKSSTQKVLF